MKILYIHQHFSLPSGGGGGRPYQFAKRLAESGHEVTMVCSGKEAVDQHVDGFRVVRFAVPYQNSMGFTKRVKAFVDFMLRASAFSFRNRADVVFASSTPLTVAIPGLIAKWRHRIPFIFEVRDLWPKIPIEMGFLTNPILIRVARLLEKITYKNADHVVALSPGMKEGVLEVSPTTSVTVVPNASDIEIFNRSSHDRSAFRKENDWPDDVKVISYAGGFGTVYSLEWVVELAAQLRDEPIRFYLIGAGSDSEKLEKIAIERGLEPSELFLGRKPREEVAKHIAASDLVMSSMRLDQCLEAASLNKVFDGFAAGLPIITNHEGWLSELIVEEKAGWKLNRDPKVAADELRKIIDDNVGLQEAGKNSLALARNQFDRNLLFERFSSIFKELA